MYWQYTTAPAFSVLAATNPVISNADNAIKNFIFASICWRLIFLFIQISDRRFDIGQQIVTGAHSRIGIKSGAADALHRRGSGSLKGASERGGISPFSQETLSG
jgi:hypothetical protein